MDLSILRPLFAGTASWASVYLDATRAEENADHQIDLRWRALSARLSEQGADEATVDAVRAAIYDHPYRPGRYGLAVFAGNGEAVLTEPLAAPPPADLAVFGPLPHAMPLVALRGEEIPYVRILAGHAGGDVTSLSAGGTPRRKHVPGSETFPITKVRAGGWSDLRYNHAVEEAWKRNAGDVAAAAADLAAQVGAEVIVVSGDPHSVPLVTAKLPRRWQERVLVAPDLDDATVIAVSEVADRHIRDAIDRYRAQGGHGGLDDVVTRLQRGQADTVLLNNDPSSTDRLWIGRDDPSLVAVDAATVRSSGAEPIEVRADAALLRAIVGTSADLVLVEPGDLTLPHGIGAILRYPDA
jgi:hypothetical protein